MYSKQAHGIISTRIRCRTMFYSADGRTRQWCSQWAGRVLAPCAIAAKTPKWISKHPVASARQRAWDRPGPRPPTNRTRWPPNVFVLDTNGSVEDLLRFHCFAAGAAAVQPTEKKSLIFTRRALNIPLRLSGSIVWERNGKSTSTCIERHKPSLRYWSACKDSLWCHVDVIRLNAFVQRSVGSGVARLLHFVGLSTNLLLGSGGPGAKLLHCQGALQLAVRSVL